MCGRYTNTAGPEELNDRFHVPILSDAGTRRYNIAPTEEVVAIVRGEDGEPQARAMRWGLIPPWAKDAKIAHKKNNARAETADQKGAYKRLLADANRRALLLADGPSERVEVRLREAGPSRAQAIGGGRVTGPGEVIADAGKWMRYATLLLARGRVVN